jgi:hypothetical protein
VKEKDMINKNEKKSDFSKFGKEFQLRLVSVLLNDEAYLSQICDILDSEYFDSISLQWISREILDFYNTHRISPAVNDLEILSVGAADTVKEELTKTIGFLRAMKINGDAVLVKDNALGFCKNQALKKAFYKSVGLLKNEDFDGIRDTIEKALRAGQSRDIGQIYFDEKDFLERVSPISRGNLIPTPWDEINKEIKGGLGSGELGILMAGPAVGKSTCLVNIGMAALRQGRTVVHYTLELSHNMVGVKYDSLISGLTIDEVSENSMFAWKKINEFRSAHPTSHIIIKQYPNKSATINTLRSHLYNVINRGYKPDIIIVDYADELKSTQKFEKMRFEYSSFYEQLRSMAFEFHCPVWSASQINRDNMENEIVTITGLSESFAKSHIADLIISMTRTIQSRENSLGTAFLAKNRIGVDYVAFDMETDLSRAYINIINKGSALEKIKNQQASNNGMTFSNKDEKNLSEHWEKFKNKQNGELVTF